MTKAARSFLESVSSSAKVTLAYWSCILIHDFSSLLNNLKMVESFCSVSCVVLETRCEGHELTHCLYDACTHVLWDICYRYIELLYGPIGDRLYQPSGFLDHSSTFVLSVYRMSSISSACFINCLAIDW